MIKITGNLTDVKIKSKVNTINFSCKLAADQYGQIAELVTEEADVTVSIERRDPPLFDVEKKE